MASQTSLHNEISQQEIYQKYVGVSNVNCLFPHSQKILAARVFGRVETAFFVKIESKWVHNRYKWIRGSKH